MSDADRRFIAAIAEETAQTTVSRLFDAARDPERVEGVVEVWVGQFDRVIGRAVRSALMWLAGVATVAAAVKLGALEKVAGWLK